MRPWFVSLLALPLFAGCRADPAIKPPYTGLTDPLPLVVQRVNARNTQIESLQAQGSYDANLIDPQTQKKTSISGDIALMYLPPKNLLLVGKVLVERAFTIGANDKNYWLTLPSAHTMYWGEIATADAQRVLPVRPDLLAEVIGVTPLEPDLLKSPVPTMRFNNDQDCYMVTWNVKLADHWATQKEIWYDRETLLPRIVLLFDNNGRIVLRAYLSKPAIVEGYEPPVSMPTVYDMYFPDTGSTFVIRLNALRHDYNGAPNPRFFVLPLGRSGMDEEKRIDG